jgi:hypothetical protein
VAKSSTISFQYRRRKKKGPPVFIRPAASLSYRGTGPARSYALLSSHAVRIQSAVKVTAPRSMGGDPELPATERAQVYSRIRSESAPASRLSAPSLSFSPTFFVLQLLLLSRFPIPFFFFLLKFVFLPHGTGVQFLVFLPCNSSFNPATTLDLRPYNTMILLLVVACCNLEKLGI